MIVRLTAASAWLILVLLETIALLLPLRGHTAEAGAAAAAAMPLTRPDKLEGFGAVRFGMTAAQVEAALGGGAAPPPRRVESDHDVELSSVQRWLDRPYRVAHFLVADRVSLIVARAEPAPGTLAECVAAAERVEAELVRSFGPPDGKPVPFGEGNVYTHALTFTFADLSTARLFASWSGTACSVSAFFQAP